MEPTIYGSLFPTVNLPDVGVSFNSLGGINYFSLQTQAAIRFFEKIAIRERRFDTNAVGLWQSIPIGRDQKARFAGMSTPKWLLSSRRNGCAWTPKGKILTDVTEFSVYPITYQGQECPDAFWNSCFETLFGTGNDVLNLMSTPEGQNLVKMMLNRIYTGLGNSASMLVWYGNHPDITTINTSGFYACSGTEWLDFYDQQTSSNVHGVMTLLDDLRGKGIENYTVPINDSDIDETTGEFVGDIIALLNSLKKAAKPEFQKWIKYGYTGADGKKYWPIIMLTQAEFDAYGEYIQQTFPQQQATYNYLLMNESGDGKLIPGVLMWKHMPVISWDEVGTFDQVAGTVSHKAGIFAPGFFGVAHDVTALQQYEGMGLVMAQRLDLPYQGQIYMNTNFRIGCGLADTDFAVYASNVKLPTS